MRRFPVRCAAFLLLLPASISNLQAQRGPSVFVTPIPQTPFSGVIDVQRTMIADSGYSVAVKTILRVARDNQGRVFFEVRALLPASDPQTPGLMWIWLYDPQTRISSVLNPREKTYRAALVNRPPATVPPGLVYGWPAGNGAGPSEFTKQEDLGHRSIEGFPVHGFREIQTIPADRSGTGKEIVVTDEYWYSDDLQVNLQTMHSDPRSGDAKVSLTQITRADPDPRLFQITNGYRPATDVGK